MANYSLSFKDDSLEHHGIEGQKWGVRNGPPYPLSRKKNSVHKVEGELSNIYAGKSIKDIDRKMVLEINKENRNTIGGWYNCSACSMVYICNSLFGQKLKAVPMPRGAGRGGGPVYIEFFDNVVSKEIRGYCPLSELQRNDDLCHRSSTGIVAVGHHAICWEKDASGKCTLIDPQSGEVWPMDVRYDHISVVGLYDFTNASYKGNLDVYLSGRSKYAKF